MSTATPAGENEVSILARVLGNEDGEIPADLARYILDLQIGERDRARMHDLAVRNQDDELTPAEKEEMFAFGKAATLLSILKSQARRRLGITLEHGRPRKPIMEAALIRLVSRRANLRCEYCRMPQSADDATFEIDHIVARKHGGPTAAGNLCLSCYYCNSFKGSDLSSLDPKTRRLTPLFHPRRHKWAKHFRWRGAYLLGRTPIGRVTVALLHINDGYRVELRERLIQEGVFPPDL